MAFSFFFAFFGVYQAPFCHEGKVVMFPVSNEFPMTMGVLKLRKLTFLHSRMHTRDRIRTPLLVKRIEPLACNLDVNGVRSGELFSFKCEKVLSEETLFLISIYSVFTDTSEQCYLKQTLSRSHTLSVSAR